MQDLHDIIASNFLLLTSVAVGWVLLGFGGSAVFRIFRGKPLFAKELDCVVFSEKWTSGRSLKTFLSRIGGAKNVICVQVSKSELSIQPHFPFTLLFLPEVYGLEYRVALSSVRVVKDGQSGRRGIVLALGPGIEPLKVELSLRNPDAFLAAVGAKAP
jgi:hypothetical protein